jgi:hypothetical protein
MTEELKTCPVCKAEGYRKAVPDEDGKALYHVQCSNAKCFFRTVSSYDAASADRYWNLRPLETVSLSTEEHSYTIVLPKPEEQVVKMVVREVLEEKQKHGMKPFDAARCVCGSIPQGHVAVDGDGYYWYFVMCKECQRATTPEVTVDLAKIQWNNLIYDERDRIQKESKKKKQKDWIKELSAKIEESHLREVSSLEMFNGVRPCKDCAFYEGKNKLTDGLDHGICSRWQPLGKHTVSWFMRCNGFIQRDTTLDKGQMMSSHNRETLLQVGKIKVCKECGLPGVLMLHYNEPTGDRNRPADGYYIMHPPNRSCSVWNLHQLQPATAIRPHAKEAVEEWNESFGPKPGPKPASCCGNCRHWAKGRGLRNPKTPWGYCVIDHPQTRGWECNQDFVCGEHEYKEDPDA